jgi:branched-subunit amino acid aminotransferase/4-amino-4-deoxychorismate lyase
VAVRGSTPRRLSLHIEKLAAAALRLGVPLPAAAEVQRAAHTVAAELGTEPGWVKIAASRSGQWAVFGGSVEPAEIGAPVTAIVLPWRRHRLDPAVGIKSLSYVPMSLGLEEARRRGAGEGFWLNDRGHLIGASTGNVFVIRGRSALTPGLADGARDGVTRGRALRLLKRLGFAARTSKVRVPALRAADEVLITSSVRGVRPVISIDGRSVGGGVPGKTSRRLAAALEEEREDG